MKVIKNIYRGLISEENIFGAWREFRRGKGKKQDVLCFERDLEDNLFLLLDDLEKMNYQHGGYQRFYIRDPKFRVISKSSVRDRVVHHLIKHKLRVKYYFRYADDFIILDERQFLLERAAREIDNFLKNNLALRLNESKTKIRKFRQGIDFCGYIVLPYYRRLRTKTARRMLKKSNKMLKNYFCGRTNSRTVVQSLSSYFGMLKHCHGRYLLNALLKSRSV